MERKDINRIDRSEWLGLRKSGIGGSDAGAVCGVNPYRSALAVYQDKISEDLSDDDNEAMRQGRDLEEYVAKRFSEATGLKVKRSGFMYRSDEHSFMIADIDRLIIGEKAGLECKTASAYSSDKWRDGAIPESYEIQCRHYMAVMGFTHMYIACLILGKDFIIRRIDRDPEMEKAIISIEESFWNDHVIPKVMPDPDGSRLCKAPEGGYLSHSAPRRPWNQRHDPPGRGRGHRNVRPQQPRLCDVLHQSGTGVPPESL